MAIQDLPTGYEQVIETESTLRSETLAALADEKPFLFITASVVDGVFLMEMDCNIPANQQRLTRTILESALKALNDAGVGLE